MRHGEVTYFDDRGRPYPPDAVPLNEEGRRQAKMAGEVLRDVPFDRVVSSSLARCVETAEIVLGERPHELTRFADLREIEPGRLADIAPESLQKAFLEAFAGQLTSESRFLGGETIGSLVHRVEHRLNELLADPSWSRMLIVAHGGVNRVFLARALQMGFTSFGAIEQDAACINILDVNADGRWIVRLLNHTPYNATKTGLDLTTMERLFLEYTMPLG